MSELNDSEVEEMNKYISSGKFNEKDYVLAQEEEEMSNFLGIIQIFTVYFKELFRVNPTNNIFEGIDYNKLDSTNRIQELFYDHLWKYKQIYQADVDAVTIYPLEEFEINDCEELYSLKLGNDEYGCKYLIPLLSMLSQMDWSKLEWSLLPIKRSE